MNILVTGGAGFIGSHLVEKLVEQQHEVYVIDDLSNGDVTNLQYIWPEIAFKNMDVSKPLDLPNFDVIYHLACFPRSRSFENPQRDVKVNVLGMVNILELAKQNHAKIIFSSNSGIYDTSKLPINEQTKDNPKTPYDLDKLQAEKYLKLYRETYGIGYVIFRFATVYGSRQKVSLEWKPVVVEFIQKIRRDRLQPTIYWDGEQTRDFIYVDDVVNGLVSALNNEKAVGETMILGTGVETSINKLYETVCNLLGFYKEPIRKPKKIGDIRRMRYDCAKAYRILGWKPKTCLREGIKKILET